jgi:hypothetical protein
MLAPFMFSAAYGHFAESAGRVSVGDLFLNYGVFTAALFGLVALGFFIMTRSRWQGGFRKR